MTKSPRRESEKTPYKGPESYQSEDAGLFFGRDYAAQELKAIILSSKLTILHAHSGAGKTSLLNARIMPDLESERWTPIRIRLEDDPIVSTRISTLNSVLPSPESEKIAMDRVVEYLERIDEKTTINELLVQYDALPVNDPRRRILIEPVSVDSGPSQKDQYTQHPYFCRLLSACLDIKSLVEHYFAVKLGSAPQGGSRDFDLGMGSFFNLRNMVADPGFHRAYKRLLSQLNVPISSLELFFSNLFQTYGVRRTQFKLILIYDQFEELFTRFVDPGPISSKHLEGLPDWKLRPKFFEKLGELYTSGKGEEKKDNLYSMPIRYVISLRSEYLSMLEPLKNFVQGMEESSFHLRLLSVDQSRIAIKEPARHFGYGYSDKCYNALIKELTKEEKYVEPAHLQIVCEKLWRRFGKNLVKKDKRSDQPEAMPEIKLTPFNELGGIKGILKSFFTEFLNELNHDDRLETLEILEPLITTSGTRNIVEKKQLTHAPFRDTEHRKRLLNDLINNIIVRIERRLGGYFAEITHEFLIGPILGELGETLYRDADFANFRYALQTLGRLEFNTKLMNRADNLLLDHEFTSLDAYREKVAWTPNAAELMLKSAVVKRAGKDIIRYWITFHDDFLEKMDKESRPDDTKTSLQIISEYLSDSDPEIRMNAARAVSVIHEPEYLEKLVMTAVKDRDEKVGLTAQKEILDLPVKARAHLLVIFDKTLVDVTTRLLGYALLGRLKAQGLNLRPKKLKTMLKLSLAVKLSKLVYPKRGWKIRATGLIYGVLGFIITAIMIGIFEASDLDVDTWIDEDMFFALLGLGYVNNILGTQRVFPIKFQPRRIQALIVETASAVSGPFILGVILFLSFGEGFSGFDSKTEISDLFFLLGYILFFGVVRWGTAIIPRTATRRQFDIVLAKAILGVFTGMAFIFFLSYLIQTIFIGALSEELGYLNGGTFKMIISNLILFLPLSLSFSLCCIHIESLMKPVHPEFVYEKPQGSTI